jgi:hypothetical protein
VSLEGLPHLQIVGSLPGSQDDYSSNVEVDNNIAYVDSVMGNFKSIDVRDPTHPRIVGSLDKTGNVMSIKLSDQRVYIAGLRDGLQVVNVETPLNPRYDSAFYEYGYVWDVDVNMKLVVLAAEHQFVVLRRD